MCPEFWAKSKQSPARVEAPKAPCCPRTVRVFAQRSELTIDLPELLRATLRYFDATLDVLSQIVGSDGTGDRVDVELRSEPHGYSGRFSIRSRWTSEHD